MRGQVQIPDSTDEEDASAEFEPIADKFGATKDTMHKLDISMVEEWVHSMVREQLPDGMQSRFRESMASMVELQNLEQLVHAACNYYTATYLPHQQTKAAYKSLDRGFLIPKAHRASLSKQERRFPMEGADGVQNRLVIKQFGRAARLYVEQSASKDKTFANLFKVPKLGRIPKLKRKADVAEIETTTGVADAAAIYASASQEVKQSTMTEKEKSEVRSRTPTPHKFPNPPTHTHVAHPETRTNQVRSGDRIHGAKAMQTLRSNGLLEIATEIFGEISVDAQPPPMTLLEMMGINEKLCAGEKDSNASKLETVLDYWKQKKRIPVAKINRVTEKVAYQIFRVLESMTFLMAFRATSLFLPQKVCPLPKH